MPNNEAPASRDQIRADVALIEAELLDVSDQAALTRARTLLRYWLFAQLGQDVTGSIADAVGEFARSLEKHGTAACVFLRCLSVSDLVPQGGGAGIGRFVVEWVGKDLPEVCDYLGVNPKAQTYQSYAILRQTHADLTNILIPLTTAHESLGSLLSARKQVVGERVR